MGTTTKDQEMDRIAMMLPVLSGKTNEARAFMRELEGSRRAEYAGADRQIGVAQETWFLQSTPNGDVLILYMEGPDLARTFSLFVESRAEIWVWFKQRLLDVTGQDWNSPPSGPVSEVLSHFDAGE